MREPELIEIAGHQLVCRHCENALFHSRGLRLNAVLDWAGADDGFPTFGTLFVCGRCGWSQTFVGVDVSGTSIECPRCGSVAAADATSCGACGSSLEATPDSAAPEPLRVEAAEFESAPPVPDDACLKCGAGMPIGASACLQCGWSYMPATPPPPPAAPAAIEPDDVPAEPARGEPTGPATCGHCEAPRRPGALICSSCGRIYDNPA